jgi:carboxymethylenebutenolidase
MPPEVSTRENPFLNPYQKSRGGCAAQLAVKDGPRCEFGARVAGVLLHCKIAGDTDFHARAIRLNYRQNNGTGWMTMGEMTRMTMADGADIAVYHAPAVGARRGGLVLIQEIFGVTDHIRELCDDYAAEGYEVLAPALFDREHPGFEAEYTGVDFDRAVELARVLHPFEPSLSEDQACITSLRAEGGPVFIIGYCYGGSVAWRMAQTSDDVAAASAYYGSLVPTMFKDEAPRCATIAHFGRFDAGIPMEGVEALIARDHPTVQIFVYDANHGFNSDRRKDYHEPSADLAWERTLALFKACGG